MRNGKLRMILVLILLVGLLGLAGCGQAGDNSQADNSSADTQSSASGSSAKFNIYLAGATPGGGGVWDMIGAGLAEAIMNGNNGSVVTVVPGGGVSDVPTVSGGDAELGLTHSSIAAAAEKGIDPFEQKYGNVKGITSLYMSKLQVIVNPKGKINSIADIKEQKMPIKLAIGDPGSTGELATKRMLEAYGMSYEDIESWGGKIFYKDMGEAASMFSDGLIDAFTLLTTAPNGPLQQVAANKDVKLLPVDDSVIQKMVSDFGYDAAVIPQSAYQFMDSDINTFSSQVVLVTNDEQSEDEIYNITRGLVENLDYIQGIHSNLKDLTAEIMANGTGVSLHKGALKYYREIGAIK